jgi:hypothetical protein
MPRWGKPYKDRRNWKEYNEELVIIALWNNIMLFQRAINEW